MATVRTGEKPGLLMRVLNGIEAAGNRLPDPVTIFVVGIILLVALSVVFEGMGLKATHPGTGKEIAAVSLLSPAIIQKFFVEMAQTFTAFPPLGLVLVTLLGVGVAERSGLIAVSLGAFVRAMPPALLTPAVVFAGVQSSLAADAGYVVLTPLAAALFASVGRHPLAGLAAAYAGVSGGFSANLLITGLDPLLAGITQSAAQLIDPNYTVAITANYFLMIALVPVITIAGWWVSATIVEPRLNTMLPDWTRTPEPAQDAAQQRRESRGLWAAGVVLLALVALFVWLTVPEGAPFRAADGSVEPFLRGLVGILAVSFFLTGFAYGVVAGTIRSDKDVVRMMGDTMGSMGMYIVLAFFVAQFLALFSWSNLGAIMAINGAQGLQAAGFTGLPLLLAMVLMTMGINLMVGSASAKWAILAPIFVPMLMLVGITPEATQAAYRIGDSATNPISPLLPYFPLVLVMAQRYIPNFGIGSFIATLLPYSVVFAITTSALFALWFALDLPFFFGTGTTMPVAGG